MISWNAPPPPKVKIIFNMAAMHIQKVKAAGEKKQLLFSSANVHFIKSNCTHFTVLPVEETSCHRVCMHLTGMLSLAMACTVLLTLLIQLQSTLLVSLLP